MTSGALDIAIDKNEHFFQGEDRTITGTIYDSAGAAQNITGWTIKFDLQPTEGGTPLFTKTATLTDAPNGVYSVAIASTDTTTVTPGTLWFQLYRDDAGNKSVLRVGDFVLLDR